jgi:hypothetical protein
MRTGGLLNPCIAVSAPKSLHGLIDPSLYHYAIFSE